MDNLLLESNGISLFTHEGLIQSTDRELTVSDCFEAYVAFCNSRGWNASPKKKFGDAIADAVTRAYGLTVRHDIPDAGGKRQRGWKGLRVVGKSLQPTDKAPSEVSGTALPDKTDGQFPVQPANPLVEEFV